MKKFIKRAVSWLLISGMVLAEPTQVLADNMPETIEISGQRLDDVPEDGNYVYLGTSSVNVTEGNGVFSLPIYRTDDTKKASVTIRAISLTADYGKDYALVGSHKSIGFTSATLMQLITGSDASDSSTASDDADNDSDGTGLNVRTYEGSISTATPSQLDGEPKTVLDNLTQTGSYTIDRQEFLSGLEQYNKLKKATDTEMEEEDDDKEASEAELISTAEDNESAEDEDADSAKSPLARLKEEQTGLPTRETEDTVYSDPDLTDQVLGNLMPESIRELPYACEQVITFAAGEDTAELKFRIYDNSKSDGNRIFSLYIVDPGDAEVYKVTSTSVTIEDDEETVHPSLSFDSETYDASDNTATVTIRREGLENSMATAAIYAYDISTGEETALGEVAFLPYENEKVVKLNVDHEVTLELTDLKAAEEGEITTAHVTGAKRDLSKGGLSVLSVDDVDDEDSAGDAAAESEIMLLSDEGDEDSNAANDNNNDVDDENENGIALASNSLSTDSGNKLSFTININNTDYEVQYDAAKTENGKLTAPVKGKIYDTVNYSPALEIGEYYFSTPVAYGGMYDYTLEKTGDPPFGCGTLEEYYTTQGDSNGAWNKAHGNMKYYHTTMWRKGTVYNKIPSGKSVVDTTLYQAIVPDIASTSGFGGGQETHFVYKGSNGNDLKSASYRGSFSRRLSDNLALRVKKGKGSSELEDYDYIYPYARAVDSDWHTPKSYVEYYGFAALYKTYNVSINNPVNKRFKSFDTTIDALPVQTEVASGADKLYEKSKKMVYVNADENKSNLVFKLKKSTVNGQDDVFCELKGYTISIGSGNNTCILNYPEDLKSFINSSDRKTTALLDYSPDAKKAELKKLEDIATVALDSYFIDWIDTVQLEKGIKVIEDGDRRSSQGYYQNLTFTPVVDYINVNVKVTAPVLDGGTPIVNSGVAFKDSELKEGKELIYHAGDRLDLSISSRSSQYTVMGYEVSTDGGRSFNTIRNTNELVLRPGNVKGYIIRPCVQANDNCIEITYSGQSQNKVHVDNVIPQSALAAYPELKGRYFIDINPNARDPYERMRPESGKCYSIDVIVDDDSASSSDKVTRPTVTDKFQDKTYNTNKHYLIAKKNKSDNRYVIGTEETEKARISSYTLSGQIVMKAGTIRSSALGYHNVPMVGYTVFTGGEQLTFKDNRTGKEQAYVSLISSVVPEDAVMSLSNIKGAAGDRITIAIDNGINDTQVEEAILGDLYGGGYNLGQFVTTYPITAPYFVSVDYEYDNKDNSQKVDHRDNTVNCFDDTLTLTASINPNGREIEKVVFLVYTSNGTVAGKYEAMPKVDEDENTSNSVFEVRIDKMLERFNNGDRVYAYIVDKAKKQLGTGTVNNLPIVYPTMDTGLIMCVQNELIKPKDFNAYYEPKQNYDLSLIGKPAVGLQSGVLSFTKTKNADNTMYMLTVNMDGYFANKSALTYKDKYNKFNSYWDNAARINAGRKLLAVEQIEDEAAREQARRAAQDFSAGLANDQYDAAHPGTTRDQQVAGREANFTQSKIISGEACFTMGWSFVYDPVKNDYVMATFAITVGGMIQISKTFYWVVGYVPIYLNLTASAQASVNMTWVKGDIQYAVTEGDFNNATGVKDLVDRDATYSLEIILKGKASLGAGVQGCLSVRVYGSIAFDVEFVRLDMVDDEQDKWNSGLLISAAVGVGIDLIATSGDFDLIKGQVGFGSFEGKTEVSYIGGEEDDYSKPKLSSSTGTDKGTDTAGGDYDDPYDDDEDEDDGFYEDGEDEEENAAALTSEDNGDLYYSSSDTDETGIRFRRNGMGTNDFSSFANYDTDDSDSMLRGIPAIKDKYALLNPAAEHTRSRIVQLTDNKQLIVFLGASKVNPKESTLYYAVGHGQSWNKGEGPIAIDDDGTFDTTPDVLKVDDNRVLIAWANARESVSDAAEDDDFTKKYTVFKINAAFYDIKTGEMGEVFTLQDDAKLDADHPDEQYRFFNLYPRLSMQGDKIYCTYLKRDISGAYEDGDEIKLLDLKSLYSSMAYVTCDLNGENVSEEQYITLSTEYDDEGNQIVDPLVTDYKVQTFTLKELKDVATSTEAGSTAEDDVQYIAAIYTIDTDGDVTTGADRHVYLDIYDLTHRKNYYPVKISSNKSEYVNSSNKTYKSSEEVTQSSPQLNKLGGKLYATWIEDGHDFVLVDLSETLQTLLGTDGISEYYTGGSSLRGDAGSDTGNGSDSGNVATPSEYRSSDSSETDTIKINTGISNAALSAETKSLLRVLKNNLTGGSTELITGNPRTWRLLGSSGWLSNSSGWNETDYSDVSSKLKSYYTELYKDAFTESGNKYTKEEQDEILAEIKSDAFAEDSYNTTVFGKISGDDINRYMIDVSGYDGSSGIGEYKLAYDGTDIYVLYTDTCENPEHLGTELFGMRFRQSSETASDADDEQEDGFTTPVMITVDDDTDDYMDEFDVCLDSAKNMYVVANSFKIGTDADGKVVNGAVNDNTLMYYYFEPGGSITADVNSVEFAQTIVRNEQSELSFNIENHGLFDAENGYDVVIDIVAADGQTVIKQGIYKEHNSEALIKAGEQKYISADWEVPDMDLTGCLLRITTKENGYDEDESVSYVSIPVKANVVFEEDDISYDGENVTVTATITNLGNADCTGLMLKLFNYKNYSDDEMQQQYIGTLKSGESKQIELSFKADSTAFDSLGYIKLKLAAMSNDKELDSIYPSFMPNRPVLCEINGGIDKLTLNQGETSQLTVKILPWNSAADSPSYSSSDPTVAYVDENGIVHAVSGGKCTITVYYPGLGISASVEVTVKGSDNNSSSRSHAKNRGSAAIAGYGSPIKGAIRGEWTLHEDGRWTFTGNGRRYASEWAYIYNPYASGDQEQYDWFRFDADGNMLTGWYQDTDGRWYYLWELSNNLLGHMVTGWNYIGGKWYYFSTVSGGPLGAMLSSAWTPDGYHVGADGAWTGSSLTSLLQGM